eukprot:jgi/Hompol1/452/HPOL_004733-RA
MRANHPATIANHAKQAALVNDIEIIDDLELSDDDVMMAKSLNGLSAASWNTSVGVKISPFLAVEMRKVLFTAEQIKGKAGLWFDEEWRGKGFVFQSSIQLAYGLVQIKGGPCGILAAVQAFIIKHLSNAPNLSCTVQSDMVFSIAAYLQVQLHP